VRIIDHGTGAPLVLIPGIQGRWEYMRATVDALAAHFRVLTASLGSHTTLSGYARDVASVLDEKKIDRAMVCGISFGGMVALEFAAAFRDRTTALVLASTPPPVFRLRKRHEIYTRMPWLLGPLFLMETPWRLLPEVRAAIPNRRDRRALRITTVRTFLGTRLSFSEMAGRARLMTSVDLRPVCANVSAPTLIVTGEPALDFVVPVNGSSEYARLIPNARSLVLDRTGHVGSITRPHVFASAIKRFVDDHGSGARVQPGQVA